MTNTNFLEVNNLWAGYLDKPVITDVSLSVKKGEFIGIIGPNGAGKSTLVRSLSRTLRPFKGTILHTGRDIYRISSNEAARAIAVVPQDTLIVFEFFVWDIVMLGRTPYLKKFKKMTEKDLEIVEKCLNLTKTSYLSDRLINELSAGERQRVIITKALAQEPQILILDEPTSHLDISHQIEILDLLKGLAKKEGLTVIVVLHDLNLAAEYCDKLILMSDGKVFVQGTPEEVLHYQTIEEVYRTIVLVGQNPVSKRPYVFLVSNKLRKEKESAN